MSALRDCATAAGDGVTGASDDTGYSAAGDGVTGASDATGYSVAGDGVTGASDATGYSAAGDGVTGASDDTGYSAAGDGVLPTSERHCRSYRKPFSCSDFVAPRWALRAALRRACPAARRAPAGVPCGAPRSGGRDLWRACPMARCRTTATPALTSSPPHPADPRSVHSPAHELSWSAERHTCPTRDRSKSMFQ
jgi:hypothetical protein